MYWVYVLESLQDGTLYIGSSADPNSRLRRHNSGQSRYTARKRPWKLLGQKECSSKEIGFLPG